MTDMYCFDWNDQKVLSRNRLAPRIHFYPYADLETAKAGRASDRVESLAGSWNFDWFPSPLEVPAALLKAPYDAQAASIRVPLNWQFAGYGKRSYTDLLYPFPVDPPHIPLQNETGVYRRAFRGGILPDERLFLRFEGVESAFHVYVNGTLAGYSQGSRMPSEFDITEWVHPGEISWPWRSISTAMVPISRIRTCGGSAALRGTYACSAGRHAIWKTSSWIPITTWIPEKGSFTRSCRSPQNGDMQN